LLACWKSLRRWQLETIFRFLRDLGRWHSDI
jgi:hypothetical protein